MAEQTPARVVDFHGATAVVTGGASGIGKGMARAFRDAGCNVVLADVDEEGLAEAADELGALGVRTDVADPKSVADLAEAALAAYGVVHVVCNNAGVGPFGPIAAMTLEDWRWVLEVNLQGVINGVHAFLPLLEQNGTWGQVVNTSSISALIAPAGAGAYVTSKAAVLGLTEALAADLRAAGSHVGATALIPGTVRTNIKHSLRTHPDPARTGLYEVDLAEMRSDYRFLEPEEVGLMVLEAIRRDDLYLVTHPELLPLADARLAHLAAGAASATPPR